MTTLTTGKATEFITFTRASNATVTDSDGKVKWAPHNLLTNSESFDAAGTWSLLNTTVGANTQVAPNSTTTADTLTTSNVGHGIFSNVTVVPGTAYTLSFWAKRGTMTDAKYSVYDATNAADIVAATSYYSAINSSTFTLVSVTFTSPAGCISARVYPVRDSGVTGTIHLWGAHLYRSDLGGMQPNTSAYPMYNPTTPKNLAGFTEDFSGTGWTRVNLLANGSGSVANAAVNPVNSLQTADLIVESTANGYHSLYRSFTSVANTPYLWSAYVKPAGRTIVQIAAQATGNIHIVEFNLTGSGTATTRSGSGTAAITALSDGWYRISTIATATGSGTAYWQLDLCSAANTNSYTGDGVSGIYLWGAQLSDSASLDSYSPVYGAAVTSAAYYGPRRDFDGATLACKGLLVEEQRSNLQLYSGAVGGTGWADAGPATRVLNALVSPDGTQNATQVTTTGGAGYYSTNNYNVTSGASYTGSLYVKFTSGNTTVVFAPATAAAAGGTEPQLRVNLQTGAYISQTASVTAYSITNAGNGWFRISASYTASATTATYPTVLNSGIGVYGVYGAQLEANASFATSYIPVGATTAGATRNADVASVSTQAFPYSATAGALVVNFDSVKAGAGILGDQTGSSALLYANSFDLKTFNGSAGPIASGSWSSDTATKGGIVYDAAGVAICLKGGTVVSNAGLLQSVTTMELGRTFLSTYLNGHIRQITYIPRRLSNAELQARTV